MKKYTIKEFAEGKKAVKIENEEQWNKLNKAHKLTYMFHGAYTYGNKRGFSTTENWYKKEGWEILEFSQLDFEDEFVEGWYRFKTTKNLYRNVLRNEIIWSSGRFQENYTADDSLDSMELLTDLSEIQQYLPSNHPDCIKKDTFVLPEKWFVKATRENEIILRDWRGCTHTGWKDNLVMVSDKYWADTETNEGYTEITFEEFKTHVLKESTMQEIKVGSQFKVSGESTNTIYTFNRIEGDDVDVTWNTTQHVHYYLSTCLDNIKDGSWILINKEKTMEKEIIEYKLKFAEYIKAANTITGTNTDYTKNGFVPDSFAYQKLKEAGVLDLWFEPVYAPKYNLPCINSFEGMVENGSIVYGCAQFQGEFFKLLKSMNSMDQLSNRKIKSITLDSDVIITMKEIEQIVEFINNK